MCSMRPGSNKAATRRLASCPATRPMSRQLPPGGMSGRSRGVCHRISMRWRCPSREGFVNGLPAEGPGSVEPIASRCVVRRTRVDGSHEVSATGIMLSHRGRLSWGSVIQNGLLRVLMSDVAAGRVTHAWGLKNEGGSLAASASGTVDWGNIDCWSLPGSPPEAKSSFLRDGARRSYGFSPDGVFRATLRADSLKPAKGACPPGANARQSMGTFPEGLWAATSHIHLQWWRSFRAGDRSLLEILGITESCWDRKSAARYDYRGRRTAEDGSGRRV